MPPLPVPSYPFPASPPEAPRRPHRWTGRPKGRPKRLPENFDEVILAALKRRMDRASNIVVPSWSALVEEFHIGRNTLAKAIRSLKEKGYLKILFDQSVHGSANNGAVYVINPHPVIKMPRIKRPAVAKLTIENWPNAARMEVAFDRVTVLEGGFGSNSACIMNAFNILVAAASGKSAAELPYSWIGEARPTVVSAVLNSDKCANLVYSISLIRKGAEVRIVQEGVFANCRAVLERTDFESNTFALAKAAGMGDNAAIIAEAREKLRNMWLLAPDPFLMGGAFRRDSASFVDMPFANLASYIALQCGANAHLRRTMLSSIRKIYTPIKDFSLEKPASAPAYLAVHYCGERDPAGTPFEYIGNDEKMLFLAAFVCAMNEFSGPLDVVWNSPLNWLAPKDAEKVLALLDRSFSRHGQLILVR